MGEGKANERQYKSRGTEDGDALKGEGGSRQRGGGEVIDG